MEHLDTLDRRYVAAARNLGATYWEPADTPGFIRLYDSRMKSLGCFLMARKQTGPDRRKDKFFLGRP